MIVRLHQFTYITCSSYRITMSVSFPSNQSTEESEGMIAHQVRNLIETLSILQWTGIPLCRYLNEFSP